MKKYTLILSFFICLGFILCLGSFITMAIAQPLAPSLRCVNQVGNGNIEIVWENNEDCGAGFVATYIYSSDSPNGPFGLLETITDPNETSDLVSNSSTTVSYYYVQMECVSGLSEPSDTFDYLLPQAPEIVKVTVSAGATEVVWTPSPSPETFGYLIYRVGTQGVFQLIDSVFVSALVNPNEPTYIDVFGVPDQKPEEYDIATFDFCRNSGARTNNPHTTIFLSEEYDSCANVINMEWTPYDGWDGVQAHKIFKGFIEIDEVPADQFSYSYTVQPGDPSPLRLAVNAVNNNNVTNSNSNELSIDIDLVALPTFIYLRNVSVINENQIQLEWVVDNNGAADHLLIKRGNDQDALGTVVDLGPLATPPQTTEVDNTADTQRGAYYYAVLAENSCGVNISTDTARTIFLDGQDNFDLTNGLQWNDFVLPNATIIDYTLHRIVGGELQPIDVFVPGQQFTYIDAVEGVDPNELGQYCYKVECRFESILPNGSTQVLSSFSNNLCISQTSRIFVPNAFAPNGINNIFKPVIVYPNYENYTMTVLNRWGEKVFETTDPDDGWDGNVRGNLAQQGVYAYVIQMESTNGSQLERKGTVLLIR